MGDSSRSTPVRNTDHQRAYKACIPCRKRKAKCDLGGRDGPPCLRCRRELRECIFSAERSWNKKRKNDERDDAGSPSASSLIHPSSLRRQSTQGNEVRARSFQTDALVRGAGSQHGDASLAGNEETLLQLDHSQQDSDPDLAQSVMRTVVSNGNDALHLLFQAATQERNVPEQETTAHTGRPYDVQRGSTSVTPLNACPGAQTAEPRATDIHKLWRSSRFVKLGWLSADEAIMYIDLFFKNMSPLSPVLSNYYADYANHHQLLTMEPLLCCTLLMISSRHHILAGAAGASRGYFIHDRLWRYCEHLIMRLMLGQEKGPTAKMRTLGSVEAMLLITEWHPRALHFPPELDGWDSDLVLTTEDEAEPEDSSPQGPSNRWLEDVVEPARRSDTMSWMLLGCGLSLAHELNVFGNTSETSSDDQLTATRKARAGRLLYIFINQLASRLGATSLLPQSISHGIDRNARSSKSSDHNWDTSMFAWTELTKLLKSLSDMVFPSEKFTQQLLQSGRYVGLLEHFQPLLEQWRTKYLDNQQMPELYTEVLFIEYQYVRIVCNSVGMQAVCDRTAAEQGSAAGPLNGLSMPHDTGDQLYIDEVISGSCDMLEKIIVLAEKDALKFAPVRVFLRITTASVFLLKAMSIGVRNGQLRSALSVLHRSVQALRSSVLDDMHLANRYAVLLEMHIKRLQKSFVASSRSALPSGLASRPQSSGPDEQGSNSNGQHVDLTRNATASGDGLAVLDWDTFSLNLDGTTTEDDWLSLPFDPAMAPFGPSGISTFPVGLDNDGLNFIWNLPA